jgi:beta-galactosidase
MPRFEYRDGRFFRDCEPFYFLGVEYQYYRDRRDNWAARLDQLAAAHCNVICFYVPWRHHIVHDPRTGRISYDFDGATLDSRDLRAFLRLVEERGLWMLAKPGPFVHSELNIGGLPDVTSPTFNAGIEPVRVHDGKPLFWEYDATQLPSPHDATFDAMAKRWLREAGDVLRPHAAPAGGIIAIQLLDETIYCSSNDAPWHFAYDAPDVREFHRMLHAKYRTIRAYNRAHGTAHRAFETVSPPRLDPSRPVATGRRDALALVDWGEFQWRIRRDLYARYKGYLGIDLPCLTNYAGITPPIDENVPDRVEEAGKQTPQAYRKLYPEWWLSHNRVDQDLDVYEYGMISWLGVAAYNVQDASTPPADDVGGNEVFLRYINTARRRRGINIEENWGFATLYHPLSKYPVIPVFQTLACIAGGCTGYVVFTGVCHGYWTDDLDRTTKKQHPTFPSHAPIGEHGETGDMYEAMKALNGYFAREGAAFLRAEPDVDVCLLAVPEYAAVSSWVPEGRAPHWLVPHAVPRCGHGAIEPATMACVRHGIGYAIAELPALSVDDLLARGRCAVHLAFFLARAEQEKLAEYLRRGGTLIVSGEMPAHDERMEPCTLLAKAIAAGPAGLVRAGGEGIGDGPAFLDAMRRAGWSQNVTCSDGLAAFVYRSDTDTFLLFFNFDRHGTHAKSIEFHGQRLDLVVGSKTSGIVRVRGGRIASYLVKAVNEFEGETAEVELRLRDQRIAFAGDSAGYDL